MLFDPHCEHLPGISASNPGKRIDFVATAARRQHPDQFAPYCAFGCDARSIFSGTLFRFPLRTPALAARSRVSKQARPLIDAHPVLISLHPCLARCAHCQHVMACMLSQHITRRAREQACMLLQAHEKKFQQGCI